MQSFERKIYTVFCIFSDLKKNFFVSKKLFMICVFEKNY